MELSGIESVFENCDFTRRKSVKETIITYIAMYLERLYGKEFSKTEIKNLVGDMAEAILEDIEVEEYSRQLWEKNMLPQKEKEKSNFDDSGVIQQLIKKITKGDEENPFKIKYGKKIYRGIEEYTVRYSQENSKKIEKGVVEAKAFLEDNIGRQLYEKIYPVFWLEMINKRHVRSKSHRSNPDNPKSLIDPIYKGIEKEEYLSALLLDCRTEGISTSTIFSGIQRLYTARYDREGKEVGNYDMQDASQRYLFVKEHKKRLLMEKNSGNRNKKTFLNNLATIREMLEMGQSDNIDIPAFLFWLDNLTGWIEFYNFVSLKESNTEVYDSSRDENEVIEKKLKERLEKKLKERPNGLPEQSREIDELREKILKCTDRKSLVSLILQASEWIEDMEDREIRKSDKQELVDRAAFEYLIEFNHMAFLYIFGKKMENMPWLKDMYQSILGNEFCEKIADVYEIIIEKKQYVQSEGEILKSKWYCEMYDELFINDFSKVNKASRMEALNFYDAYITFMKKN